MEASKKVLFVITKANWGGAQRYVFDLASSSKEKGFSPTVLYGTPGGMSKKLEESDIPSIELSDLGRDVHFLKDLKTGFALYKIFRKEKPDVVHLNSSKIGLLGGFFARLAKVPNIIFTAHGWAFNEDRPAWQKYAIYGLTWLTLVFSHKTIVVSKKVYDQAPHFLVKQKISIIYNSIRKTEFENKEDSRKKLGLESLNPSTFLIGTIAELHKNKGHVYLLSALAQLRDSGFDIHAAFVGDGEEKSGLMEKAEQLGLEKKISFLGFVENASQYVKAFDAFVLPSITEAFAYVLLEAGSAQMPIIATRVGGIPEIIENDVSGLLVRPKDPKELALVLSFLMQNKDRAALYGKNVEEKIKTSFSFGVMCEKTFALYN